MRLHYLGLLGSLFYVYNAICQESLSSLKFKFSDSLQIGVSATLTIEPLKNLQISQNTLTINNNPTFSWIAINNEPFDKKLNSVAFYNSNLTTTITCILVPLKDTLFLQTQWFSKHQSGKCQLDYGFESFGVKSEAKKIQNPIAQTLITESQVIPPQDTMVLPLVKRQDIAVGAVPVKKTKPHAPQLFKDAVCFSIQFGRFEQASDKKIKAYVKHLGIKKYKLQIEPDFKVILFGAYATQDEAKMALQEFKKRYSTDAFVVEYRYKKRILNT